MENVGLYIAISNQVWRYDCYFGKLQRWRYNCTMDSRYKNNYPKVSSKKNIMCQIHIRQLQSTILIK